MNISSTTKLYAIIGDPIEHSLSPIMQNAALQHLGLDSIYLAFRVRPQDLKAAVAGLMSLGVSGFNVTVPHKISVMKYLNKVDDLAVEIGAVNTVVNKNGTLIGYNTDGLGALAALRQEGVKLEGRKVVLLGAGGAAKALAFSIAPLVANLVILNRTGSRAKNLASSLAEKFHSNTESGRLTENVLHNVLTEVDVLINTTSVGMYPKVDETIVKRAYLHQGMTVFDIIYNPLMTRFLKEAKASGANILGGVKMLVYQGALAFELWTGMKPPVDDMFKAVEQELRRK
ncbi:MAG: shikimate dehydrogenase [Candidatus Bathyarchaeota archaeon]